MILPDLFLETSLWQRGYKYIVGIDEVGRGSWAGPLVASGVILPKNFQIPQGLADSKMVRPQKRIELAHLIQENATACSIIEISPARINKIGIGKATHEAFRKIILDIKPRPNFCLVDAFHVKHFPTKNQMAVKNGDKICASIAAASIVAKVYRDNLMRKMHFHYPSYGFGQHKGYGTKHHQEMIKKYGFCKIHRTSYNLGYLLQ